MVHCSYCGKRCTDARGLAIEDSKSGKEAAKENETWAETDFDWDDEGDAGLDEESNCDSGMQGMTGV